MNRFSDFATEEHVLDGEKIRMDDLLNQEIPIIGYRITESKFGKNRSGKCLTIQVEYKGERRVVFTGSDVLIDQLERYGDNVPFLATIRKVDRFYKLT